MKKIILSIFFSLFIFSVFAASLPELDAAGFRRIAKEKIAFVNFNRPTCDLAQYFNDDVAYINTRIPDIPIYYFDKSKYPEIEKEFQLWSADRIALLSYGKKVDELNGVWGYNVAEEWFVSKWNEYKGTNIPIRKYRKRPSSTSPVSVSTTSALKADLAFNGNGLDRVTNTKKFHVNATEDKIFEYKNNTFFSKGKYRMRSAANTTNLEMSDAKKFSIYYEFFPMSTQYNNLICAGNRFFAVEIQKNQLTIMFDNGNWRYYAKETYIEKNKWHALALSFDYERRLVQVILDGKRLDDFVIDFDVDIKSTYPSFGMTNFGNGQTYYGFTDRLQIYDHQFKDGQLHTLYNTQRRSFPNMTAFLPNEKQANYSFNNLKNSISQEKFYAGGTDNHRLINGRLYVNPPKDSYPRYETEKFLMESSKFTVMLDFELSRYSYSKDDGTNQFTWFYEMTDNKNYLVSTKIQNGELEVGVGKYPGHKIKSRNANIQVGKSYNMIVTYDYNMRFIKVLLDGKIIIQQYIPDEVEFDEITEGVNFQLTKGSPYRFIGYIDNLKIFANSYNQTKLMELYKKERIFR